MENGTVILYRNEQGQHWLSQFVCDWIEDVTESPFVHAREYLNGYLYETRHPGGFRKTLYQGHPETAAIGTPKVPLNEYEIQSKIDWWEDKIRRKLPYNYPKLFLALILHKTKPFWEKVGFVPFQNIYHFGDFCFAAVDESYRFVGVDIAPNQLEQISTGKHFTDSNYFIWGNT